MTGFLDLPPELRNKIYFYTESLIANLNEDTSHYHLNCGESHEVHNMNWIMDGKWQTFYGPNNKAHNKGYNPRVNRLTSQPNITRACKTLRAETLPIFYGANTFVIRDYYWPSMGDGIQTPFPKIVLTWLDRIKAHLPLISDLEVICSPEMYTQQAHEIVSAFTELMPFRPGALKAKDI